MTGQMRLKGDQLMVADTPENYARYPGPMKFIRDVPTDWEETRVLNGEIGDYVTIDE